jgi:hypothetical protein
MGSRNARTRQNTTPKETPNRIYARQRHPQWDPARLMSNRSPTCVASANARLHLPRSPMGLPQHQHAQWWHRANVPHVRTFLAERTQCACHCNAQRVTSLAMLASKDSTSPTMLRALAHTSNALDAAITLDIDCTDADRAFFQAQKTTIDGAFDKVDDAHRAAFLHDFRELQKHQARIVVGDAVLDRGVRRGKKRVALESNVETADRIFGEDISEIVDAERHLEPGLVVDCINRLAKDADFTGKIDLVADLTGRANRQAKNFSDREVAVRVEASLDADLANAISQAADALYTLEKRLLERFPRDKVYVRAFFFDVGSKRKKNVTE